MNTEINLLEKKPKKSAAALVSGISIAILLMFMAAVLIYQTVTYQAALDRQQRELSEIESALIQYQKANAGGTEIKQLKEDIAKLKSDLPQNLFLYQKVTGFLTSPAQLVSYDSSEEHHLIMDAEFAGLDYIAKYIRAVGDQAYITDIQLTSVTKTGKSYMATLTITPDIEALGKELAEDD